MTAQPTVEPAGQVGHVVVRPGALATAAERELMPASEMMVDTQIELIAIDVGPHSEDVVGAASAANPDVMAPVQSVMRCEIIRQRHLLEDATHQWIDGPPIWIPRSKYSVHIAAK